MADERLEVYESKMTKTLDGLRKEYLTIRAGRANPHILDKLTVDLLWNTNTTAAGGKHYSTGSPHDSDSAMGSISD